MDKQLLYKYFEGSANEQETNAVLQWVNSSEANKQQFIREKAVWDALCLHPELLIAADSAQQSSGKVKKLSPRRIIYAAAAILLLVMAGWWLMNSNHAFNSGTQQTAIQQVTVPVGQRMRLTLPDGSKVWLNATSTLRYAKQFSKNERIVELDGEGYFEVTHHEKWPFTVKTNTHNIHVLGTVFNVNAYGNSELFETTLISGSVEVESSSNTGLHALLKPGEHYQNNRVLNSTIVEKTDAIAVATWKTGLYQFNDISFGELLNELKRYKDINITVTDSSLLSHKCTGKFREQESIGEILDVIKNDIPLQYQWLPDRKEIVISKAR